MGCKAISPNLLKRREFIWPLIIFLLALSIRLTYLYQMRIDPTFNYLQQGLDMERFDRWAMRIAQGDLFLGNKTYFQAPFYTYFLAAIYRLFGHNYLAVRLIQFLIGSFTCLLIFLAGREIFGEKVGVIAGLLSAFYGPFIFYEGVLLRAVLVIFLTSVLIYALAKAGRRPRVRNWLFCGAILGLSILTRPNALILTPFIIFWIGIYFRKEAGRRIVRYCALFLLGILISLLPLFLRNQLVGVKFYAISAQGPIAFMAGNNYDAQVVGWNPPPSAMEIEKRTGGNAGAMYREAWRLILKYPKVWGKLQLQKFSAFWNAYEVPNNVNFYLYRRLFPTLRLSIVSFGAIAPLGIVGIFLCGRRWRKVLFLYLLVAGIMASVLLFYIISRFRQGVVPPLILFAAYTIFWAYRKFRNKQYLPLTLSLMATVLLYSLLLPPYGELIRPNDYFSMGMAFAEKGRSDEAINFYQEAIKGAPFWPAIHYFLGLEYSRKKMYKEAIRELRLALYMEPNDGFSLKLLAMIYSFKVIDYYQALYYWNRFLKLFPGDTQGQKVKEMVLEEMRRAH